MVTVEKKAEVAASMLTDGQIIELKAKLEKGGLK